MASVFVSNPNPRNHDSTQNLPHDITIDILTKLPVKSLLRVKGVCKSWHSLLKDDKFIKQHYDTHKNCQKYFMASSQAFDFYHYTMDVPQIDSSNTASLVEPPVPIDELRMAIPHVQYFSCNGMFLIIYDDDLIVLWNPATRESRRIPSPILNNRHGLYNFCYLSRTNEYKILRLGPRHVRGEVSDMEIDIFTTKGNTWRSIGIVPRNYYFFGCSIVMVDGIAHLMAKRREVLSNCTIVRFCLEKEQFKEDLLFPSVMNGIRPLMYCLGDKLYLTRMLNCHGYEFWLYMMETSSWNKISIPITYNIWLRPLSFMKDGEMMFQNHNTSGFVAHNSTTHKLEQVNVTGIEAGLCFNEVVNYVETLYSPNS